MNPAELRKFCKKYDMDIGEAKALFRRAEAQMLLFQHSRAVQAEQMPGRFRKAHGGREPINHEELRTWIATPGAEDGEFPASVPGCYPAIGLNHCHAFGVAADEDSVQLAFDDHAHPGYAIWMDVDMAVIRSGRSRQGRPLPHSHFDESEHQSGASLERTSWVLKETRPQRCKRGSAQVRSKK